MARLRVASTRNGRVAVRVGHFARAVGVLHITAFAGLALAGAFSCPRRRRGADPVPVQYDDGKVLVLLALRHLHPSPAPHFHPRVRRQRGCLEGLSPFDFAEVPVNEAPNDDPAAKPRPPVAGWLLYIPNGDAAAD